MVPGLFTVFARRKVRLLIVEVLPRGFYESWGPRPLRSLIAEPLLRGSTRKLGVQAVRRTWFVLRFFCNSTNGYNMDWDNFFDLRNT